MNSSPHFETVVRDHGDAVLRVCRAVLGPHVDADDAWSETFLAALARYDELGEIVDIRAWLVTIAHRKALDVIRRRGREAITVEDFPDGVSALGNPGDAPHEVWTHLATLTLRQRECLALRYVADLGYREIAERVGGTEEAARRAAADGRAALRRALTQHGTDPAQHSTDQEGPHR